MYLFRPNWNLSHGLFTPIMYLCGGGPAVFPRSMAFSLVLFGSAGFAGSPWGFQGFPYFQGLKAGKLIVRSYVTILVGYIRLCLAYARLYSCTEYVLRTNETPFLTHWKLLDPLYS